MQKKNSDTKKNNHIYCKFSKDAVLKDFIFKNIP